MTDTEYLEIMVHLTHELEQAASAKPYDPDAYNAIIKRLNNVQPPWIERQRRRHWFMILFVLSLFCLLAYILWWILNPIEIGAPL